MRTLLNLLVWVLITPSYAADFYVAPSGSPSNTGSYAKPWDLQTALNHPTELLPGDTIWLRGGVYPQDGSWKIFHSKLSGNSLAPITVRQYPGEPVAIEGSLFHFNGGYVHYRGFEIKNSSQNHTTSEEGPFPTSFQTIVEGIPVDMAVAGIDIRVPGVKLIHLVVHDHIGGGIGVSIEARDFEMSECVVYYNGWQGADRGHGHGIYAQSADPGTVLIRDSVFYGNYALGIQSSGASSSTTDNVSIYGNSVFQNGILAREHQQNLLVGPFTGVAKNLTLEDNSIYDTQGTQSDVYLGYTGGLLGATIVDNYFGTSVRFAPFVSGMALSRNSFVVGAVELDTAAYPGNDYAPVKTNVLRIRPSLHESGRALVTVFNWQSLSEISVDLGSVLVVGAAYEIRNVQDYYGSPVGQGIYQGTHIILPMAGLSVASPAGAGAPPTTAPEFAAFVIVPTTHNTPPVISSIDRQTIPTEALSQPVSFIVSDQETAAQELTVSSDSSNSELLPQSGILFSGEGKNRSVRFKPAPGGFGRSFVRLNVSDGTNTASTAFVVIVMPPPDLEDGLLAGFDFDETTGATFQDLSGNAHTATLVPGYYLAPLPSHLLPGKAGTAALFLNGDDSFGYGTGDYATLDSSAALNVNSASFTLSAWIKTRTSKDVVLINKYSSAGLESGYLLAVDGASNGGRLRLRVSDGSNNPNSMGAKVFTDSQPVNDDTWHHIALVVDRANSETSFFVDGTLKTLHTRDNSGNLDCGAVFGVGRATGSYGRWFHGAVDEVRVHGRALWPNEIESLAGFVQPNTPPTITPISNQVLLENTTSGPISFQVEDLETADENLLVSATSTNLALLPNDQITIGGTAEQRTLILFPNTNQFGVTYITVIVTDGTREASTSFVLTVSHVNRSPEISPIADQTLTENTASEAIEFIVSDLETPPADLQVSATSTNTTLLPAEAIVFGGSGANRSLQLYPAQNQDGATLVTITVSDGAAQASTSFVVTVSHVNRPPEISPIADQTLIENTASEAIEFIVSDLETPPADLQVSATSTNTTLVPAEAIVFGGSGANRSLQLYPAQNQDGATLVTITVSDGAAQASTSFVVTVSHVNRPPEISPIADQTLIENTASEAIEFIVSDLETPPADLQVSATSTNTTLLPAEGIVFAAPGSYRSLRLYPAQNQDGTTLVTVTVSDGAAQASTSFVVEVKPEILEPLPMPTLTLKGNSILLTWQSQTRVKLQSNLSLDPSGWEDVPDTQGIGAISLPCCDSARFFRLARDP